MTQGTTKGVPIDTDSTLSLNSDQVVASQKATKTYVDGKVASAGAGGSNNEIQYNDTGNLAGVTGANSATIVTSSVGVPEMTASMTSGQLVVGSTGATPTTATLTAGSGINITNGAGTITIDGASSESTITVVAQATHNLTVGMAIKGLAAGTYEAATADSAANAEVVGIVTVVPDNNNFTFVSAGQTTTMVALTANSVYFLDPVTAGLLTLTEPTTAGQISRPVLYTDTTTSGFYLPYRGVEVGASSTTTNNAKNLIIGGDFSLNPWQRGTSFAAGLSGIYSADRFVNNYTGTTAVVTITKAADAPTVAEASYFTSHSFKVDCTTADAAVAAGDLSYLAYHIEGYDFAPIAQRIFTLSFWVKATKTGVHCASFQNSAADRSYVAEYTIDVTNTWEKKTITVAASPSAGTWDYTNGRGLSINFGLIVGTTFHTTKDAWQTGSFLGTSSIVNDLDNVANNFQIALVQVEAGSGATSFEIRSREQELALCQRYYQKSFTQGVNPGTADINGSLYMFNLSTTKTQGTARFPVDMRTIPTVAVYSPATGTAGQVRSSTADKAGSATTIGDSGFGSVTCTGLTAAVTAAFHFTASSEL